MRTRLAIATALILGATALLTAPATPVAAAQTITVRDGDGRGIPGALVAVVGPSGAIDTGITGSLGTISLDTTAGGDTATTVTVSAAGYTTATATTDLTSALTVTLDTAPVNLDPLNIHGAGVFGFAGDAIPGVAYAVVESVPSVYRTTDFGGTWAPVPTVATSPDGLPQGTTRDIVTSGHPGEVAVVIDGTVWYSRDFGNTWGTVTGATLQPGHLTPSQLRWARAGTSSYLLISDDVNGVLLAVMPTTATSASPVFAASGITGIDDGDHFALAGDGSRVWLATLPDDGTNVVLRRLTAGATTPAAVTSDVSVTVPDTAIPAANLQADDLLRFRVLEGGAFALLTFDNQQVASGWRGTLRVAYTPNVGGTWYDNVTGGNPQIDINEDVNVPNWTNWTGVQTSIEGWDTTAAGCGNNGTRAAASIAPLTPPAGTWLDGFEVVGTIRQCWFAFNATGGTVTYGASPVSRSVADGTVAILPMEGANNNTGFVFDAGYDFDDNQVALTGDGYFGLRKSAAVTAATGWRPAFGSAGNTLAGEFIDHQAEPFTGADTGGIAVNGLTAAVVADIAHRPSDPTGSMYAVTLDWSGGSRTLVTTDGGESFSTLGANASQVVTWWNGADGVEYIASTFDNTPDRFLWVKPFRDTVGSGAMDMGDELSATAAERDTAGSTADRFAFPDRAVNPATGCFSATLMVQVTGLLPNACSAVGASHDTRSANVFVSDLTGLEGTDKVIVGVRRTTGGVENTTIAGTVAMVTLAVDEATGRASASEVRYFGANIAAAGTTSHVGQGGFGEGEGSTYDKGVLAIAHCPTEGLGSAPQVADTVFIAVQDQGIYTITGVSGTSPVHGRSEQTTGSFVDLDIDCATGVIAGVNDTSLAPDGATAATDGLWIGLDGDTMVQVDLPGAQSDVEQDPTAVAIDVDTDTGEVAILVGDRRGNLIAVDTDTDTLGAPVETLVAGTADTPTTTVDLPAGDGVTVNDWLDGVATGSVKALAYAPGADDPVAVEAASTRSRILRSRGVRALDDRPDPTVAAANGGFSARRSALSGGGGSTFTPVTPSRLLDTRSGVGASAARVGALDGSGAALTLQVTGRGGVPASGVAAVALNVTVVDGRANDFGGFVTAYPCDVARPDASNLNFVSGQTVPNSVIAPVSAAGTVCLYVYGTAHLLADVSGYFVSGFEPVTPVRLLDTRSGVGAPAARVGALDGSGAALTLQVTGRGGVPPSGVAAVALNVTVVDGAANDFGGYVTAYPCDVARPDASNLNFVSGQTVPNSVIAPVSATGTVCLYVYGTAHLLADVSGYFLSGFEPVTPARLLDTRPSGVRVGALDGSGAAYELQVTGRGGVPASGVSAVALNVTVVDGQSNDFGGYVTVYPCGTRPDASNLNFVSGQTVPNAVLAPVSADGTVCLYVYGTAHLLADVSGHL